MTLSRARRALSVALLAVVAAPQRPEAAPVTGMTCRIRTTLKNGASKLVGGPGADGSGAYRLLVLDAQWVPGRGRYDVIGTGEGAEIGASEFMIQTDSGTTILHTLDKTYRDAVLDIGSIVAMVRDLDANRAVTSVHVTFDSLPADSLDGRRARHYRMYVQYTLYNQQNGTAATTKVTSDYWVADLPVNFNNPWVGLARPRRAVADNIKPEIEKLVAGIRAMSRGTVVKFEAKGIIGEGTERPIDYVRTMDITRVRTTDVDDAQLRIPEGYTRQRAGGRGG